MPYRYLHLEKVGSTNAFLQEKLEHERSGVVVYADDQTSGKGMGSNSWESGPGLNLTFSMGVNMSFMMASDQFLLSQAVPLGLLDVLDKVLERESDSSESLMVKWPNDIVFEGRKLAGILTGPRSECYIF